MTVQKDVSATNYVLFYATLMPNESLVYSADKGFTVFDRAGREKRSPGDVLPYTSGQLVHLHKYMTAPEGASNHYCWSKDAGWAFGAWSPGSPGINGRNPDGTSANDYGCVPLSNATRAGTRST